MNYYKYVNMKYIEIRIIRNNNLYDFDDIYNL